MTFGVVLTAEGGNVSSASLLLTKYTSTNNNYRKVLSAVSEGSTGTQAKYEDNSDKIIRIEDIVKFQGIVNATGTFAAGSNYTLGNYDKTYTSGTGSQQKTYSNKEITIAEGTSLSSATIYLFYTVEFADADATHYIEYTKTGNNYYQARTVISNTLADDRYFYRSDYGNDTCYEGLSFKINDLKINAQ